MLGSIYRKHIKLISTIEEDIQQQISKLLKGKRTIGVHVRGTDFKMAYKGHPSVITSAEYANTTKEIMDIGGYNQVFLATDDNEAVSVFQKYFGKKLIMYDDVMRQSVSDKKLIDISFISVKP